MHQHPELLSLPHVPRHMVARDVKVPCQLFQQHLQEHGREPMGTGHIRHFGDQLVQRADGTLGVAPLRSGEMDEAERTLDQKSCYWRMLPRSKRLGQPFRNWYGSGMARAQWAWAIPKPIV